MYVSVGDMCSCVREGGPGGYVPLRRLVVGLLGGPENDKMLDNR